MVQVRPIYCDIIPATHAPVAPRSSVVSGFRIRGSAQQMRLRTAGVQRTRHPSYDLATIVAAPPASAVKPRRARADTPAAASPADARRVACRAVPDRTPQDSPRSHLVSRAIREVVSNFSARCVNSARVPLRCLDALHGNLTPSIANMSRPIRPWPSHTVSSAAKTLAMSSRSVLTKWAIVVKCGAVMPHSAMNVTCSWADPLDRPAAPDALGIRKPYDLQQHGRWTRRRARRVVAEAGVEVRQIHFVIEQVIQRVLERAGQQLAREVDAQELRIRIEELVAGHGGCSTGTQNDDTFATRQTRRVAFSSVSTSTPFGTYPTTSSVNFSTPTGLGFFSRRSQRCARDRATPR